MELTNGPTNALVVEVGGLIYTDPEYAPADWDDAAIGFNFVDGHRNCYDYVFTADGKWVVRLPDSWASLDKMVELQATMERQTDKKWLRALYHINRRSTVMNIQFEYDHPKRWQIAPGKLEESVNALRPQLHS